MCAAWQTADECGALDSQGLTLADEHRTATASPPTSAGPPVRSTVL